MQLQAFVTLASVFTFAAVYATPLEERSPSPQGGIIAFELSACQTQTCGECTDYLYHIGDCVEIPGGADQVVSCVEFQTSQCTVYKRPNCVANADFFSSETLYGANEPHTLIWGDTGFASFNCTNAPVV